MVKACFPDGENINDNNNDNNDNDPEGENRDDNNEGDNNDNNNDKKVKTIVTTIMTTMMTTIISTMVFLPVVATSRCPIPLGWPSFDKLCLKKLFKEKLPQTVSKKKLKSCDKLCSIFLKRFDKLCLKK